MFLEVSDEQPIPTILTVGHSTHPIDVFIDLLFRHRVNAISDVRSTPFSRVNPQFNRDNLQASLQDRGIAYVFLGRELGARSQDPACYVSGRVQYDLLAQTDLFRAGLQRVHEGMKTYRIALMCAERDPLQCHRGILIARQLEASGVRVQHITDDGTLESHTDALRRLLRQLRLSEHDLFRSAEELINDAYRIQAERIAYTTPTTATDDWKPLEGPSR